MTTLDRRRFLEVGGLGGALGLAAPGLALGAQQTAPDADAEDRVVRLRGDGVGLSPMQYGRLLAQLTEGRDVASDSYILGGVVDELEAQCAQILGKERAVFMPTGTLANQLAVRVLAGGSGRAIMQAESHLYQDSGDCVQTLSNITVMPLAAGRATFTADEVQQVLDRTRSGRVLRPVSVISVESPVRRRRGQVFDGAELARVVALARSEGIHLHLDGARLFLEAAYAGRDVAEYARPFDTVYVSLYKYFNAAGGAILAGPRALLDDIYHTRRMFGGALAQAWPYAVVALHYLQGFSERYTRAVGISEEVIRGLEGVDGLEIERIPNGTNLFWLRVLRTAAASLRTRLAARGILLSTPSDDGTFLVGINETLNRTTADELIDAFVREMEV